MDKVLFYKWFVVFLLVNSLNSFCQTAGYYPLSIVVGQDTGCAEHNVSKQQCGPPIDPWYGGSTSCTIDLDADGRIDLTTTHSQSAASMQGSSYSNTNLSAGDSCFICVQSGNNGLADSIKAGDVIDSSRTWGKICTLYDSYWSMGGGGSTSGYQPAYYGIKIKNGNITIYGWVDASMNNYAITSDCAGNNIKSIISSDDIKIYPNPVSDELVVHTGAATPITIGLYDFSGRKILNTTATNKSSIDTKNFSSGVYVLEIKMPDRTIKQKLVISH